MLMEMFYLSQCSFSNPTFNGGDNLPGDNVNEALMKMRINCVKDGNYQQQNSQTF